MIEDVQSDSYAARKAAPGICANLARDIANGLTDGSEWQLNVLDEYGKPVFRIRQLVESLEPRKKGAARHAAWPASIKT